MRERHNNTVAMICRFWSLFIIFLSSLICVSCGSSSVAEEDHEDEHDHEHHGGIVLEPQQAAEFGIEYETVKEGDFKDVIKTSGTLESSTSDIYTLSAKKSGVLTLNPGIGPGVAVGAGQTIATLTSEGVQGGDASQVASVNLAAAKAEYERLKPLYEEKLITASTFREVERAYKEAQAVAGKGNSGGMSTISSPVAGTIQNLFVKSGEYVDVGTQIGVVSKNTNLMLKADLPSREITHLGEIESANFISEGNGELIKLSDLNGKKISGYSSVAEGYIPVYFSFNGSPLSYPGGYVEVYLLCGDRKNVISVPREALVEIQGNKYVYTFDGEEGYEKKLVKTGASDGERIEIKDGLKEGERIVAKGASVIRMAEVSAIAPPAHTHNH